MLNSSITWAGECNKLSASLLVAPYWGEWLIDWMSPKDPDTLEKWVRRNSMKCYKDQCKVLHLGRIYP